MTKRFALALLLLAVSCAGTTPPPATEPAGQSRPPAIGGDYGGSFTIIHDYGTEYERVERGMVNLSFDRGRYTIVGLERLLPPAGSGTYDVVGDRIFLKDAAMHTADFDWTLILQGPFEYALDGVSLVMRQTDAKLYRHRELDLKRQGRARD